MDGKHPGNADPRPKRRRDQDNPYTIFTVGIDTNTPHYYMQFRDGSSIEHCLEIDRELFEAFNRFELEDLSHLNEVDNHYETRSLQEEALAAKMMECPETPEEAACRHLETEQLHQAIALLPAVQRRRLLLYFFGDFTYSQIAEMEGCRHQAVQKSIYAALKNLKKFLE